MLIDVHPMEWKFMTFGDGGHRHGLRAAAILVQTGVAVFWIVLAFTSWISTFFEPERTPVAAAYLCAVSLAAIALTAGYMGRGRVVLYAGGALLAGQIAATTWLFASPANMFEHPVRLAAHLVGMAAVGIGIAATFERRR
ncbi:MAG: hypothetical protein WD066_14330 [Planctomycetaceae bacterium]